MHTGNVVSEKALIADEGYVFVSYGTLKYLRFACAAAASIRRHDRKRPIVLFCPDDHREFLESQLKPGIFDHVLFLPEENRSIVGFKHSFYKFLPFKRTLFLDSDMILCRPPDGLWASLTGYPLAITGNLVSDSFFGSAKGAGILLDIIFARREQTLRKFGLTYLSRVQSGFMYCSDAATAEKVCSLAAEMLSRRAETHFRSRLQESGRNEESCEWSLAMAMAKLQIPVIPWNHGPLSPQVDYFNFLTEHDELFTHCTYTMHTHESVYRLRGLKSVFARNLLLRLYRLFPGFGDFVTFTPYFVHFGWIHQKKPFERFAALLFPEFDR